MEFVDNSNSNNKAYFLNNYLYGKKKEYTIRTDKKRDTKFMNSNIGRYYKPQYESSHGENYKHYINVYDENYNLIIGGEFFFLGVYNKEKNIWLWETEAPTASISIKDKVNAFKTYGLSLLHSDNFDNNILKDKTMLSEFLTNRYTVMPTNDLINIFSYLADKIYKDDMFYIITKNIDNNIGFYVITNITFSNI